MVLSSGHRVYSILSIAQERFTTEARRARRMHGGLNGSVPPPRSLCLRGGLQRPLRSTMNKYCGAGGSACPHATPVVACLTSTTDNSGAARRPLKFLVGRSLFGLKIFIAIRRD